MDRRGFFKVIAVASASAAMPTMLLDVAKDTPAGQAELGMIRELMDYDIRWDCYHLRHDIFSGEVQLSVDYKVRSTEDFSPYRTKSKELFEAEMRKNGFWWTDLKPLPLPKNIQHGVYI